LSRWPAVPGDWTEDTRLRLCDPLRTGVDFRSFFEDVPKVSREYCRCLLSRGKERVLESGDCHQRRRNIMGVQNQSVEVGEEAVEALVVFSRVEDTS